MWQNTRRQKTDDILQGRRAEPIPLPLGPFLPDQRTVVLDRFCQINGQWFFVTREKTQEGPYPSRDEASAGAERYIARMQGRA